MSGWKIYDGTTWLDPCNCNIHLLDSTNTWVLLDPKNCPTKYWNGCEWIPIVCPCNCPEGFIFNPISNDCEQVTLSTATFTGTTANVVGGDNLSAYSINGAKMYSSLDVYTWPVIGFEPPSSTYILKDNNGIGVPVPITAASVNSIFKSTNSVTGRLNIAGLWINPWPLNQWVTFEFCVVVPEEKEYVLGIGGDNQVRIRINSPAFGGLVDVVTLLADTSPSGGLINPFIEEPFKTWHLFPITLPAGTHTIIMEGIDQGGSKGVGAEIYNRTRNEMLSLMSLGATVTDLEPYILFSTKNLLQLPPLTVAGFGSTGTWSCPDPSTTFSECYGVPACILTTNVPCE
jgi:hypothetical protein